MSITKRVWIERDPAYEAVRQKFAEEARTHVEQFSFRIATRRANRLPGGRWDRIWPSALHRALLVLDYEGVQINDGLFLRTAAERDAVVLKATEIAEIDIERMQSAMTRSPTSRPTR